MATSNKLILNITFHGIGPVSRKLEPGEEQVWCDISQAMKILDLVVDRSDVYITSDDGNRSDIEILAPALAERGLSGHFFVLASRFGMPEYLNESDIDYLLSMGMHIGTHGWDHVPWRKLASATAKREIIESCLQIEACGVPRIKSAACPFGMYDKTTIRYLRRSGINQIYTSDGGWVRKGATIIARNSVGGNRDVTWVADLFESQRITIRQRLKRYIKRWR